MNRGGVGTLDGLEPLRPRLQRVCRTYLGDLHDEAADIAHDALQTIAPAEAEELTGGEGPTEALLEHLHQVCLQLCKDRLRCRDGIVRGLELELKAAAGRLGRVPTPSENLKVRKQEGLRLLAEAMKGLSFEGRQILHLRHMKGLTYAQIGATLNLDWRQVAGRLSGAREELRAAAVGHAPAPTRNWTVGPWTALSR
jgi:RNA polymerase sigma factor (sigma-70 family)